MGLNEALIPFTVPAPANRPGRGRNPVGAVLHHMAGYLPGTDRLFMNPNTGYATNIGIGSDGRGNYEIHVYVPEDQVAWGNGNDDLNARAISIEHENNRAAGSASKPTPETHELSAKYLAAAAVRWNWRINGQIQLVLADFPNHDFYERSMPRFGVDFNVTGHRSVALKDCPNDLDMAWIVARANDIISGKSAAKKGLPMPALVVHPNSSVGFVNDLGEIDIISSPTELDSILAIGLTGQTKETLIRLQDGLIWDTFVKRTARLRSERAGTDVDEAAIVAQLAPLVVAPILAAIKASGQVGDVDEVALAKITEDAVRRVFADAAA